MTDALTRLSAALSDRYTLERELGAGGMATVYLAHDVKHKRKVAIKVLKPELAAVLGADRFVVEITTTAALQHPHILPLFDSGSADGFLFYVMPFIDGETLRTKLDRETQLGIDESVRITTDVADALHYAHSQGVVHRDIKPENILLANGRPMVADFGIALALSAAAGGRMTETGMSLGTPHYMSPEQATADKEITGRSDIYSLASVLYEMLTGNPPHTGSSAQQIIMKIIAEQPAAVTQYRKSVPPNVAAAVAKALEKLPADRFGTAKAFAEALGNTAYSFPSGSTVVFAPSTAGWRQRAAVPALVAALLLAFALLWSVGRPSPAPPVTRHRVVLWRHAQGDIRSPGLLQVTTQAAISPDGARIVFSDSVNGTTRLFLKRRDASEPVELAGTDDAVSPFFSPDGTWVGFLTIDGTLKKIPADGGGSVRMASGNSETYYAGAWLDDGTIVFTGGPRKLHRVSASGGESTVISTDSAHRSNVAIVAPLPGSRGVLVTTCPGNCATGSEVGVLDFSQGTIRRLVANATGAWYAPTGHLLYTDRAGGLYAAGFDLDRMVITSGAVPIVDDVAPGRFAMSESGSVLYSLEGGVDASAQLHWVSRDGSGVPVDSTWRGEFEYPAISPDGASIAVSLRDRTTDVWIRRADGTRLKLTGSGTLNWRPFWMADGRSLLFVSNADGSGDNIDDTRLFTVPADASSPPTLLHRHTFGVWEGEVTRDGSWLVLRSDEANGEVNIRARRLSGDTTLVPLVVGNGTNIQTALSPDGRWLAYVSNRTGAREVYVMPFPGGGGSQQVSRDGGTEPRWAHSGRELFYKSGGQFVAVAVSPGTALAFGASRNLFPLAGYRGARNRQQYDVAPDDQRFIMIRMAGSSLTDHLVVVENFFEELREKVRKVR